MADFSAYKLTFTAPLVNTTGTITITQATTSTDGYLSSTDWNTFNGKVTNPMTTAGDVIYGGASGVPTRLAVSTDGYVLTLASGVPTWAVAPSGGKLIVEDLGFGLDNGSTGRNTVGSEAVSLEYSDSGSTYGASGIGSFACGRTTTADTRGAFACGSSTLASGLESHAEGLGTTASGSASHAEGSGTTASGSVSHAKGLSTVASGDYSVADGRASIANHYSENAKASGIFATNGDCQQGNVLFRIATSATSETELFLDGSSITHRFTLEDNDAYACRITTFGAQSDGSIGEAVYQVKIKRQGATTSLSQSLQTILAWNGDANIGTPAWAITADDTNDSLKITVTPANTTATRWTALLEYVKINY